MHWSTVKVSLLPLLDDLEVCLIRCEYDVVIDICRRLISECSSEINNDNLSELSIDCSVPGVIKSHD